MSKRKVAALIAAGALLGAATVTGAQALTPNDGACRSGLTYPYDLGEATAYDACRFDRLDAAVAALKPTPTPSVTPSASPTPTRTPSPSVTPSPSPSSARFPDATNTGVPAGVTLTAYAGPLTITVPGTVIDAKTVTGALVVKASGVKITNSQINGTVATDEESTGYSFSIADSVVNVGNRSGTGIGAVNFTATRVEVLGGNRSVNCWKDCTVTDSYVHGQFTDTTGVYHESGIRMGARGVIRHNTIACTAPDVAPDAGCSAALTGYGDFATVENMTIEGNLIKAGSGGFCAYGGSSAGKPYANAHDIKFVNNTWERGTAKSDHGTYICGYYGPVTAFDSDAPGNVWSGNVFDDGAPVLPAN